MDFITGELNHIEDVLCRLHYGQWFGGANSKNKIYENLVIHDQQYEKPTKSFLESELVRMEQERKDELQAKINNKASAETKLEALGLTVGEVKAIMNPEI